jgi:acyl transferase domain-containing protein
MLSGSGTPALAQPRVFRSPLTPRDRKIDGFLQPLAGWSMEALLNMPAKESPIDRTDRAQPAIFAVQVATAKLLEVRHCSAGAACDQALTARSTTESSRPP